MKIRAALALPLVALAVGLGIVSCAATDEEQKVVVRPSVSSRASLGQWLRATPKITWLRRQVSGRVDGASAWDNIQATAAGGSVRRSYYGNAPGGRVMLDPRMLRAMKILANEGYTFRVTSIAGGSHSRTSRHYAGIAFDVDMINGRKVGHSNPYWRRFIRRCRELGATETLGPGDKAHSTHTHAAWPR